MITLLLLLATPVHADPKECKGPCREALVVLAEEMNKDMERLERKITSLSDRVFLLETERAWREAASELRKEAQKGSK